MNVSTKTNSLQCTFTEEVLSLSLSLSRLLINFFWAQGTNVRNHQQKKKEKPCTVKRPLVSEKQNSAPPPEFELRKSEKKTKQWTKTPEGLPSPPLQQYPLCHKSFPTHSFLVIHHPLLLEA